MIDTVGIVDCGCVDEFDGRRGTFLFTTGGQCCRGHGDARIMTGEDRFDRVC